MTRNAGTSDLMCVAVRFFCVLQGAGSVRTEVAVDLWLTVAFHDLRLEERP